MNECKQDSIHVHLNATLIWMYLQYTTSVISASSYQRAEN